MSAWQEVEHPPFLAYEAILNNVKYRIMTDRKGDWFAVKEINDKFQPAIGQILYKSGTAARNAVEGGQFDEELNKLLS